MSSDGLDPIFAPFELSKNALLKLQAVYMEEFRSGLGRSASSASSERGVPMLPSFLPELPDGTEEGRYLALDLGGTNLRVLACTLSPGSPIETTASNYAVTPEAMSAPGPALFDFIAGKVEEFLVKEGLREVTLSLGFVFSFPCSQSSLASARLLWWTKDYRCEGVVGEDVVAMLQAALDRKALKVRVVVIMNDTVGCLAAAAYERGSAALIGGVVSTGCNVSYLERAERIAKLPQGSYAFPRMVVDTEWEEFGNEGQFRPIETEADRKVDRAATHAGKQTGDKFIAGLFLGELARELMLQAAEVQPDLVPMDLFSKAGSLTTEQLGRVLRDSTSEGFPEARKVLRELGLETEAPEVLCSVLLRACTVVSRRSCSLLAAALSALVLHQGSTEGVVGLGGSVFRHHPTYKARLEGEIGELAPGTEWRVVEVEDGSGKGAALVAAVAQRLGL